MVALYGKGTAQAEPEEVAPVGPETDLADSMVGSGKES